MGFLHTTRFPSHNHISPNKVYLSRNRKSKCYEIFEHLRSAFVETKICQRAFEDSKFGLKCPKSIRITRLGALMHMHKSHETRYPCYRTIYYAALFVRLKKRGFGLKSGFLIWQYHSCLEITFPRYGKEQNQLRSVYYFLSRALATALKLLRQSKTIDTS